MAKPIFIVSFGKMPSTPEQRYQISQHFKFLKDDYHVLILFEEREYPGETQFKMFSDKEIDPIEIENLKQLVEEKWLNINT